jgi:hypothetical protein
VDPAQPAETPATPTTAQVPASPPEPAAATTEPAAATTEPAAPAVSAVPRPQRSERSNRDMALSLVVLLVPIALVLGFYRLVLDGDEPIRVDPAPAIAEARSAAAFAVLAPVDLATEWRVSTATFRRTADGATLRIGYVDPDDDPVQLIESSVPVERLIPAELGAAPATAGTVQIGARSWQRFEARPGEAALVLLEKGRTVIVVGATETSRLQVLAATLS